MKNLIVFLIFLVKSSVAVAQYNIQVIPSGSSYKCIINNLNPIDSPWIDSDLVTWIFPDGQYLKSVIDIDNQGNILNQSNVIEWRPYNINASTGPNEIHAYVAKKGGTGNPTLTVPDPPITGLMNTATTPAAFYFPIGKTWQVNRSWDFSPNNETFLIFSYRPSPIPGCKISATDEIRLYFEPTQLMYENRFEFNSEVILDSPGLIKISNFSNSPEHKHIFFKVKNLLQSPRETILVRAAGQFCSSYDSVSIQYITEAVPHDPNKKMVDIEKICLNQFYPIKLTYTVQFQNDGTAPVKKVTVKDLLPSLLDPGSFHLIEPVPIMNGIQDGSDISMSMNGATKELEFTGSDGLPGLNQISPYSYAYDQTIYRFSFDVNLTAYPVDTVKNKASVTFYNGNTPIIPSLETNFAKTIGVDQFPGPDCYYSSTSESRNIFSSIQINPNPFLDQVDISFELLEKSKLDIEVRDIWGRLIKTIASREYTAGTQNLTWDGTSLPYGVYLLFLRTEKGAVARKMVKAQ